MAQFSYINATHSSKLMPSSIVLYGYSSAFNVKLSPKSQVVAANERAVHIQRIQEELRTTLATAVTTYKACADKKRREGPTYVKGDLVMLNARNL